VRRILVETPAVTATTVVPGRNVTYARRAMRDALERGEAPLMPDVLYLLSGVVDEDVPTDRALGLLAGYTWAAHAEAVVVYMDYGISPAVAEAVDNAKALGLEVEYRLIGVNPMDLADRKARHSYK